MGYVGAWVAYILGCVGCVGEIFTWFAWVKYIFVFVNFLLRGLYFFTWVQNFCMGQIFFALINFHLLYEIIIQVIV